jgi:hypothetical protein
VAAALVDGNKPTHLICGWIVSFDLKRSPSALLALLAQSDVATK